MENYFKDRSINIEEVLNKNSNKFIKEMYEVLENSKKIVESKLDKLYRQYAINNKLTYQEAKKLLSGKDKIEFIKEIDKYKKILNDKDLAKQIDLFKKRSRITRLDSLLYQIKLEQDYMYQQIESITTRCLESTYKYSYYHNIYNIQNSINMYHSFSLLDKELMVKVMGYKNDGMNYSERIWGVHRSNLFKEVQLKISQGIATGAPNKNIISEISKRFNVARSNSERLIRTEYNFFMNQASKDSLKESGINKYMYVATLDSRTSDFCKKLDGLVFNIAEAKVGINYPPMHPNCRSTTIAYIDTYKYKERVARDIGNKSVRVENMNYTEWYNTYVNT